MIWDMGHRHMNTEYIGDLSFSLSPRKWLRTEITSNGIRFDQEGQRKHRTFQQQLHINMNAMGLVRLPLAIFSVLIESLTGG